MKSILRHPILYSLLIPAGLIFVSACYELPDTESITMPSWEVNGINLPIVNQTKSLQEILEDDSSFAWFPEDDQQLGGVVYYTKREKIAASNIGERLTIDQTEVNITSKVGPITINDIPPLDAIISISDWTPFHPDESVIIPPLLVSGQKSELSLIDSFQEVKFNKGRINLTLTNNLPMEVTYRNFRIENNDANRTLVTKPVSDFSIEPNGTRFLDIELETGVDILNSLLISVDMSTNGTDGALVRLPSDAGTIISAEVTEIEVGKVIAEIPQNSITIDSTVSFDSENQSVQLAKAEIKSGSFVVNFDSNIDVDATLEITFHDLYDAQGNNYSVTRNIPRLGSLQISEPDMSGWKIETTQATNELSYTVTARTIPSGSGDFSEISEDDDFNVNIVLSELSFENVDGSFKAEFQLEPQSFEIDYGEFYDKFNFQDLKVEDAVINLNLLTSTYIPVNIEDAVVTASNGLVTNSIPLDQFSLPSTEPIAVGVSELFSGMHEVLPTRFTFNGRAVVNPLNELIEVGVADSIYGYADIQIPLQFHLDGGTYEDKVEMDFSQDAKDAIDNILSLSLTFEIINNIPLGVSMVASVFDSVGTNIMNIPTESNAIDKIEVTAPVVNSSGEVLEASQVLETIELTGDDIKTFLNGKSMEFYFQFQTSDTPNEVVKLRFTDTITYRALGEAKFRFDN